METHFTLDIGNSHPHLGRFAKEKLLDVIPYDQSLIADSELPLIVSKVGDHHLCDSLTSIDFSSHFKDNQFLKMPVHYSQTLGQDRLYEAYYLFSKIKDEQTLINIDAGTFTTIDFITSGGFQGGYIIPGIQMLNKNYDHGHLLKSTQTPPTVEQLEHLPQSTEQAISYGLFKIYQGLFLSLASNKTLKVTDISLTGGKALHLEPILQNVFKGIQIHKEPHLIHQALTFIYQEVYS